MDTCFTDTHRQSPSVAGRLARLFSSDNNVITTARIRRYFAA